VKRHILLVGLPGAGKTTVGGIVATKLGADFVDLDQLIEREQRTSVRSIFTTRGEAGFRELEADAAARIMNGQPAVVAPGGGWAARPNAMEQAAERSLIVYLRTRAEEAARRVGVGRDRPLLAGVDPEERMRELLGARESFYRRAEVTVDTNDRTAEQVADEVVKLARSRGGW